MEKLFNELFEAAKKNKKDFVALKNIVVSLGSYELASKLREIENELFPETEEIKIARLMAKKLSLTFRMVDLNIAPETCWLISETMKVYAEKGGEFSIDDAVVLIYKKYDIFINEK